MSDLLVPSGLWLPYTTGTYLSATPPAGYVPSDPQVDAWGDPDSGWANGTHTNALMSLWNVPADHQCFAVVVLSNGKPNAYTSSDGATVVSTACSTALPGTAKGVRVRYEKSTAKIRYYYTTDPHTATSPTWTELGTAGGTATGYSAGQALYTPPRRTRMEVGTRGNSSSLMFGGVLYKTIWTDGATTIADCDLSKLWTQNQRKDSEGNDWNLHGASTAKWQLTTGGTVGLETRLAAVEVASAVPRVVQVMTGLTDRTNISTKQQIGTFSTVAAANLSTTTIFECWVSGTFDGKSTSGTATLYLDANSTNIHNGGISSSVATGATGMPWRVYARIFVTATGASGAIRAEVTSYSISASGTSVTVTTKFTTTSAIDLSGGLLLTVSEAMTTADVANTVHPLAGSLEQLT